MKVFEYRGEKISIERAGYGQYIIRGLGTSVKCTNSEIWDWCDDPEDEKKHEEALSSALRLLKNA